MNKKREARRKRDREDFIRVTTQKVRDLGIKVPTGSSGIGSCAGPTYREHLEDKLEAATAAYDKDPSDTRRGVVRGLAIALALYEDSYNYSTERVKKIERQFMED